MKSSKLWYVLKILFFVGFLIIFIKYFIDNQESFKKLAEINPLFIIAIGLLQFGVIVVNILFFKNLLTFFNAEISFISSYKVIVKSSLINFFLFLQGGTGYRAYYTKKRFRINYKKFALLFAANSIVVFLVCALAGLIGTILYSIQSNNTNVIVISFFALLSLFMLALVIIKPTSFILNNKRFPRVKEIMVHWRLLTSNKSLLRTLVFLSIIQFMISSLIYGLELVAVGQTPSFVGLLGYTAIANLSIVLAFTPGAIGIRESLLVFTQGALGVSTNGIILSATVDRIVYFILLMILALSLQLLKIFRLKNKQDQGETE